MPGSSRQGGADLPWNLCTTACFTSVADPWQGPLPSPNNGPATQSHRGAHVALLRNEFQKVYQSPILAVGFSFDPDLIARFQKNARDDASRPALGIFVQLPGVYLSVVEEEGKLGMSSAIAWLGIEVGAIVPVSRTTLGMSDRNDDQSIRFVTEHDAKRIPVE